jgi:hypothetical protein
MITSQQADERARRIRNDMMGMELSREWYTVKGWDRYQCLKAAAQQLEAMARMGTSRTDARHGH